jgi:DnaD/phage-associated family protein
MSYFWIKFYHEVLDDSKMAVLPDRLWRRFYELCLIAGEEHKEGNIPDAQRIAWRLRMETDDIILDLSQLESIGLVAKTQEGWIVCNFAKRQEATPVTERVNQHRDRLHKSQYYGHNNETQLKRNVTQIIDIDIDKDIDIDTNNNGDNDFSKICKKYESEIGTLTGGIANKITIALEEYPPDWITSSIDIAVENNKRNWAYCLGILKRWKVDGFGNQKPKEEDRIKYLRELEEQKLKRAEELNKYTR